MVPGHVPMDAIPTAAIPMDAIPTDAKIFDINQIFDFKHNPNPNPNSWP